MKKAVAESLLSEWAYWRVNGHSLYSGYPNKSNICSLNNRCRQYAPQVLETKRIVPKPRKLHGRSIPLLHGVMKKDYVSRIDYVLRKEMANEGYKKALVYYACPNMTIRQIENKFEISRNTIHYHKDRAAILVMNTF